MKSNDLIRPPCWNAGQPCPNPCAEAHFNHVIYNHVALHGSWSGWSLAGRDLVSPNKERISVERLRGLIWSTHANDIRQSASRRRDAQKNKRQLVKVVVVDLQDWRDHRFGRIA